MKAAGDLGAGARQVAVAPGPQPHHGGVVLHTHCFGGWRAQRGDGHRQRVVGVVLVGRLGGEQPHPRRQLGLDVQDPLAGGDQLLGE
jgi:hypothetical protein